MFDKLDWCHEIQSFSGSVVGADENFRGNLRHA